MGDIVEIVSSPETVEAGFAGRRGTCYGFTTPSVTRVGVVGPAGDDYAVNVAFDDETSGWFDPSLVTVVDVNAGQVAVVGDKRFVRNERGDWIEAPD
jgi:hypothetical protein